MFLTINNNVKHRMKLNWHYHNHCTLFTINNNVNTLIKHAVIQITNVVNIYMPFITT